MTSLPDLCKQWPTRQRLAVGMILPSYQDPQQKMLEAVESLRKQQPLHRKRDHHLARSWEHARLTARQAKGWARRTAKRGENKLNRGEKGK